MLQAVLFILVWGALQTPCRCIPAASPNSTMPIPPPITPTPLIPPSQLALITSTTSVSYTAGMRLVEEHISILKHADFRLPYQLLENAAEGLIQLKNEYLDTASFPCKSTSCKTTSKLLQDSNTATQYLEHLVDPFRTQANILADNLMNLEKKFLNLCFNKVDIHSRDTPTTNTNELLSILLRESFVELPDAFDGLHTSNLVEQAFHRTWNQDTDEFIRSHVLNLLNQQITIHPLTLRAVVISLREHTAALAAALSLNLNSSMFPSPPAILFSANQRPHSFFRFIKSIGIKNPSASDFEIAITLVQRVKLSFSARLAELLKVPILSHTFYSTFKRFEISSGKRSKRSFFSHLFGLADESLVDLQGIQIQDVESKAQNLARTLEIYKDDLSSLSTSNQVISDLMRNVSHLAQSLSEVMNLEAADITSLQTQVKIAVTQQEKRINLITGLFRISSSLDQLRSNIDSLLRLSQGIAAHQLPIDLLPDQYTVGVNNLPLLAQKPLVTLGQDGFTVRYQIARGTEHFSVFKIKAIPYFDSSDVPQRIAVDETVALNAVGTVVPDPVLKEYCSINNGEWICPEDTPTSDAPTCESAIVSARKEGIPAPELILCLHKIRVEPQPAQHYIRQGNQYTIFTPESDTGKTFCPNIIGSATPIVLQPGLNVYTVLPGCVLTTGRLRIKNPSLGTVTLTSSPDSRATLLESIKRLEELAIDKSFNLSAYSIPYTDLKIASSKINLDVLKDLDYSAKLKALEDRLPFLPDPTLPYTHSYNTTVFSVYGVLGLILCVLFLSCCCCGPRTVGKTLMECLCLPFYICRRRKENNSSRNTCFTFSNTPDSLTTHSSSSIAPGSHHSSTAQFTQLRAHLPAPPLLDSRGGRKLLDSLEMTDLPRTRTDPGLLDRLLREEDVEDRLASPNSLPPMSPGMSGVNPLPPIYRIPANGRPVPEFLRLQPMTVEDNLYDAPLPVGVDRAQPLQPLPLARESLLAKTKAQVHPSGNQ